MSYRFNDDKKRRVMALRAAVVGSCKTCKGSGYLEVEGHPGSLRRCECLIVLRYLMELVIAGIPLDYWHLRIADLKVDTAYKTQVNFYLDKITVAVQKGLGLVFLGPNGVGKTSMMCEIGKEALIDGYAVRYFTLSSYITAIQKNMIDDVADMESGDILLVDELDKRYQKKGSDYVVKTLDESLRKFLGAGKALILCTNWSEDEIRDNLGESTVSLLKRRCEFIEMVGEDYSDKLQSEFWDELAAEPDYFCDAIVENAYALEEVRGA